MKGLFIPDITAKMFKDASLESVAELLAEVMWKEDFDKLYETQVESEE